MRDRIHEWVCRVTAAAYERLPHERIPVRARARLYGRLYCRIRRGLDAETDVTRLMENVADETADEWASAIIGLNSAEEAGSVRADFRKIVMAAFKRYEMELDRPDRLGPLIPCPPRDR
jgi:hypothetical protein